MEKKEFSAKDKKEAIALAIEELGVGSEEELEIEILSEGSRGILGIGARPALIRACLKEKEEAPKKIETEKRTEIEREIKTETEGEGEKKESDSREYKRKKASPQDYDRYKKRAEDFLLDIFRAMNLEASMDLSIGEEPSINQRQEGPETDTVLNIHIRGEGLGSLIGKKGYTLDSLQYLVSLVVNKRNEPFVHVKLDAENYRERRRAALEAMAKSAAYKAKKIGKRVNMEPMNAYERRIVHMSLQGNSSVESRSEGRDPYRYVAVIPRDVDRIE